MQLKEFLQQNGYRKALTFQGGNYPAPEWKQGFASIASYLWLGGLGLTFFGDALFDNLGMKERPGFYVYLKENPTGVLGSLFLLNNIANSSLSTGAFEVYLDGSLVFSKLEAGHVPNGSELISILEAHGVELLR